MESTFGISLYGGLGRAFRKKYNYDPKNIPIKANSVQEVIRALDANFDGFKQLIKRKGYYKIVRSKNVMEDTKLVGSKELGMMFSNQDWCIMPIAAGAGGNMGMLSFILGAALLVVAYVFPVTAPYLAPMGIGLMIGGLSQMLTPMPKMPESSGREDTPSYLFNGAINASAPGLTVPVAYGETWIGDIPVSFGVIVDDIGSNPDPPAPVPPAAAPAAPPTTEPTEPEDSGGGEGSGPGGGGDGEGIGGDAGGGDAGSDGDGIC